MKELFLRIIRLIRKAQELALKIGIGNILQPGLVKEMIISEILGHELIVTKRDADARDKNNSDVLYEYLSFSEGGSGQLDRMFKEPVEKREGSLQRITRNKMVYFAVFYKKDPLRVKVIYEVSPEILLKRKLKDNLTEAKTRYRMSGLRKIGLKRTVWSFTRLVLVAKYA